VPTNIWVAAEQLKEEFPAQLDESVDSEITDIELAARFLYFASNRAATESQFLLVARTLFVDFRSQYLKNNDVHAVTRALSAESKKTVIKGYFNALVVLKDVLTPEEAAPVKSALFEAASRGDAKLFAIFGGQGNIEEYFDELEDIWVTYQGIVKSFVNRMADVLAEYARSPDAKVLHSKGLDVLRWLEDPTSRPDVQYLISAPVSLPLIGLAQILQYYVMVHVLGRTFSDVRDLFAGKIF
jgi:fatty acid synthase subunit beta